MCASGRNHCGAVHPLEQIALVIALSVFWPPVFASWPGLLGDGAVFAGPGRRPRGDGFPPSRKAFCTSHSIHEFEVRGSRSPGPRCSVGVNFDRQFERQPQIAFESCRCWGLVLCHVRDPPNEPASRLIPRPVSINLKSCDLRPVVQSGSDVLASVLVCQGEIASDKGQTEAVEVSIGTLELMESAAWLLERRVVCALDSIAQIMPAPIFPYEVATALGEYLAPNVNEDGLLACVLAALQSSDSPAAFPETLKIASDAVVQGNDPVAELRKSVGAALRQGAGALEAQFQALETKFNGSGIMAVAMRQIIAAARAAFQMREKDPFFELAMIADIASGASVQHILQRIPSCALKQEEAGAFDQLQRDVLISFQPLSATSGRDPEDGLRTIHAIFHYVSSHLTQHGFVETSAARHSACPFYTSCNLPLRKGEPNICRSEPWLSASWPHWGPDGKCWYGTAVSITTPPPASPPQAGS
jgi:hypothetical protein